VFAWPPTYDAFSSRRRGGEHPYGSPAFRAPIDGRALLGFDPS
jgi:hypothetical protein